MINETNANAPIQMPFLAGGLPGDLGMQMPNQSQNASWMQMVVADQMQANTIWTQMVAEAKKARAEQQKIMHDTQTKLFEMQQDTHNNWLATSGKSNAEFCKAIMA